MIEADCTFVESVSDPVRVLNETNCAKAWGVHVPSLEARLLAGGDKLEAHHLFPPPDAALAVRDRQVDVPEAIDRRKVHDDILPRREPQRWSAPRPPLPLSPLAPNCRSVLGTAAQNVAPERRMK